MNNHKYNDAFWNIFNKISGRKKKEKQLLKPKITQIHCDYCCQFNTIEFNGENYICTNKECGKILQDKLSFEQEWRYYGNNDTKSSNPIRVGNASNKLLPESSLGTFIGNFHNLNFSKIQKFHNVYNSMPYKERSLNKIFKTIKQKCSAAGIPTIIINQAKNMYVKLSETKISRGSNRKGLEGTCVYMACKQNNVPRSAKEIANIFNITISEMTKGIKIFKNIIKEFNNNIDNKKEKIVCDYKASKPLDYIDRFCSNLNIIQENRNLCEYITNKSIELNIVSDNTPASIAAGSIFMVSIIKNLNISKTDIANACKISEVTISKCFKKMYDYRSHIIPKNIVLVK